MRDELPRLREGDKLTGQACVVPACLSYCPDCDCLRRDDGTWHSRKVDGFMERYCHRHDKAGE